jgi:hypothetical protein
MSPYQQFIDALKKDELRLLMSGIAGIGCDDSGYCLTDAAAPLFDRPPSSEEARALLKKRERQILSQWFSQRPLCRVEFDYQAKELLSAQGAARFCRHDGNKNNRALMIDEWRLIAVGPDDVRSRYGYFCEEGGELDEKTSGERVMKWLKSGEAYDDYRTKTHCRYCR